MVEFKKDPRDGQCKLMEINPRFWGSLELSVLSGVNFPYLLYRMETEGDIEPVIDYKEGIRCRWLLPGDIVQPGQSVLTLTISQNLWVVVFLEETKQPIFQYTNFR